MQSFRIVGVLCVLLASTGTARAEGAPVAVTPPPSVPFRPSVALGSNLPFLWNDANSVAASLSVSVADRHAVRANVASYKNRGGMGNNVFGVLSGGSETDYSGRFTDVGVSWVYYPRRVWSGFLLEAGALRRARDTRVYSAYASPEVVNTASTIYAARAMIGWSWLVHAHVFISAGLGLSVGRESGIERSGTELDEVMTRTNIARRHTSGEGYLRVGATFDL